MSTINKVFILGNLTNDPLIQKTQSGSSVANFGVATNQKIKTKSGETKEQVQYHNITCWNAIADLVGNYCKKGEKIMVEGFLEYHNWEQPDGTKRTATKIIAEKVVLLGSKKEQTMPQYEEPNW